MSREHGLHLALVEHAGDVEVAGASQEVAHLVEWRIDREAAVERERCTVGVDQIDRTARVRCASVERAV